MEIRIDIAPLASKEDKLQDISDYLEQLKDALVEMYQDYIDGKKELREINMEFNARYVSGEEMPVRGNCPEAY